MASPGLPSPTQLSPLLYTEPTFVNSSIKVEAELLRQGKEGKWMRALTEDRAFSSKDAKTHSVSHVPYTSGTITNNQISPDLQNLILKAVSPWLALC